MNNPTTYQARRRAAQIMYTLSRADHPDFAAEHAEELARNERWPECQHMSDEELAAYCRQIALQQQDATLTANWPDGGSASSDPKMPAMPQPPEPDHLVPADGRPEPASFDFDFEASEQREHLRVLDHWNDDDPRWAIARLREITKLPRQIRNQDGTVQWVTSNARVADIACAFEEIGARDIQLAEARELACHLLAVVREISYDFGCLAAQDPDLVYEQLPGWLTGEQGAPEDWQRPYADEQAQRDAADPPEYDPDYGKDLDYDDEYEDQPGEQGYDEDYEDEAGGEAE